MKNIKIALIWIVYASCIMLAGCDTAYAQNSKAKYSGLKSNQPNIIFILTDDMGWGDLGVLYQNKRKQEDDRSEPWHSTPHLDSLANEGALLINHYSAAPLCAPSRASLLSGLSQGHANVRDHQTDKALADNHTMASVLKKLGYATSIIGKWGLQGRDAPPPDWPADPLNRGFDYFLGYISHFDGHNHYPKESRSTVWENDKNITSSLDKSYTADLWTAAAKKWIINHEKNQKDHQPFFLYLAYDTPHAKLQLPTQSYPSGGGLNGGVQWIGKRGHMINTASGKIDSWVHPDYAKRTYDDDDNSSTGEVVWPDVYKRYATSIRRIDSGVGDIMELLKDLNIDENTLVVFSSDNGPSRESYLSSAFKPNKPTFFDSFGPFDGMKRDTWEGGVRVPTIAYWKGHIPGGRRVDEPNNQYDWLPTFLAANGVPAPANADGVSLLPSLAGNKSPRKPLVYIEYFQDAGKYADTPVYEEFAPERRGRRRGQMQNIRMGNYVGVRYNVQSPQDDFEIYNVVKDPGERNNLADNPEGPPLMKDLEQRMKDRVLQVRMPQDSAPRPYDNALIPAVVNEKVEPGVLWKAYVGNFPWVPEVATLQPTTTGEAKRPTVSVQGQDNEVFYFTGYIRVPENGAYTFYLKTDTGGLLRIHDATVIDADYGYKGGTERKSTIQLEAGLHPFRLYYMRKLNDKSVLDLEWSGPDISKQPISNNVFFH